jgi:MFS family permease
MRVVVLVSMLTFLHYVAAQMRSPVLPLYAAAHGATAAGVGLIIGAHMALAALGSIPLGRASDVWGRRPLLLGGMILGVGTSLLLPLVESELALMTIFGLAGLGVAAFTPSALSMVGDAAPPGMAGRAFAWYSMAHYGAIGIGPFLGGLAADWWGYRGAFVASALGIALALVIGSALPARSSSRAPARPGATFADVRGNPVIWAGWILSVSGLLVQGVVFTFFPLLGHERGLTPTAIGVVFLVLGLANMLARWPAGWLIDRTGRCAAYAVGGVLVASGVTALLPHAADRTTLLVLVAIFGTVSGIAFVAVSVALASASTPVTRGLVMGGYSTCLYLGLAVGSFAFGPIITRHGYSFGFSAGAAAGVAGTLLAASFWLSSRGPRARIRSEEQPAMKSSRPAPNVRSSGFGRALSRRI